MHCNSFEELNQCTYILSGADKLEHGIDYNDSEDDTSEDNVLEGEEDGTDSYRGFITNDAPAHGYRTEVEQILSIQNLPGSVNYGFNGETEILRHRKTKCEVGIQVDLDDTMSETFC